MDFATGSSPLYFQCGQRDILLRMNPLNLHYREYPSDADSATPIVLLHGFLGSGTNWHSVARQLCGSSPVLVPDLRNHGKSPHHAQMDYAVMCVDLLNLLDTQGYAEVILVGHSMGGKLAMEFALQFPERVSKLVVVDIAPVKYRHDFAEIFAGFRAVGLSQLGNRTEAEQQMATAIEEQGVRQFLLQNLIRCEERWQWRIDLDLLQAAIPNIQSAPPALSMGKFAGPVSVIYGDESNYLQPAFHSLFKKHFPNVSYMSIPGAGHWVYAEQPELFMKALQPFLAR